jgi:hypothetical protein
MRKKIKYGLALVSLCALFRVACMGQQVMVSAHLDSSNIRIGEQVHLHIIAAYDAQKGLIKIQWPAINDSLISKVKVVSKSKIDTIITDSTHPSRQEQRQDILITSFDSGYYAIPPFTFIVNGDTANPQQTEPVMLQVHTVSVDTTKGIKDIKAPYTAPWSIYEILPWIGIGAAALLVIVLIIYFVVKQMKKKKPEPIVYIPPVDPHVKALNALEELKLKKLWQEGKIKEYHSTLTDILRIYIDDRFRINAPEMITSEIVQAMRRIDISAELKMKLQQTLILSDLVKFAKEQPLPHENENSLTNAIEFVKGTIPEAQPVQNLPPSPNSNIPQPASPSQP